MYHANRNAANCHYSFHDLFSTMETLLLVILICEVNPKFSLELGLHNWCILSVPTQLETLLHHASLHLSLSLSPLFISPSPPEAGRGDPTVMSLNRVRQHFPLLCFVSIKAAHLSSSCLKSLPPSSPSLSSSLPSFKTSSLCLCSPHWQHNAYTWVCINSCPTPQMMTWQWGPNIHRLMAERGRWCEG